MNHMEQVAEMLGVELEEEFKLLFIQTEETESYLFKFTHAGLLKLFEGDDKNNQSLWMQAVNEMFFLLGGDYEIIKLPWKPKNKEKYWAIHFDDSLDYLQVGTNTWCENNYDYEHYIAGNCFRTKEEAKHYIDKYIEWLKSKEPDVSWRD